PKPWQLNRWHLSLMQGSGQIRFNALAAEGRECKWGGLFRPGGPDHVMPGTRVFVNETINSDHYIGYVIGSSCRGK
ncbi:MAG TPA: hypothetical protein PKK43_10790, partial [Spirochaetota bacterium]|nr:hypothetical protein [Spirochaetota bacterium]